MFLNLFIRCSLTKCSTRFSPRRAGRREVQPDARVPREPVDDQDRERSAACGMCHVRGWMVSSEGGLVKARQGLGRGQWAALPRRRRWRIAEVLASGLLSNGSPVPAGDAISYPALGVVWSPRSRSRPGGSGGAGIHGPTCAVNLEAEGERRAFVSSRASPATKTSRASGALPKPLMAFYRGLPRSSRRKGSISTSNVSGHHDTPANKGCRAPRVPGPDQKAAVR